jgi:biopolymer transport protein ExbD/biopolymer transport protein TolR
MAYKPKVGATMSAPNVIPMADIMLVLLIIFMVVTPMLQKGKDVNMPRVDNPMDLPNADKDDAVIIAVARDGGIFIGNDKTRLEDLTSIIRDKMTGRIDKTIFIRSDNRAKYSSVTAVVDNVRSAGVDQVGLLTQRVDRRQGTAPPPPPTTQP